MVAADRSTDEVGGNQISPFWTYRTFSYGGGMLPDVPCLHRVRDTGLNPNYTS